MDLKLLVLAALIALVSFLAWTLVRLRRTDYSVLANHMARRTRDQLHVMRPCPVCHSMLQRGERVNTIVYGKGEEDRIAHIFGCRYCFPHNPGHQRRCPVCDSVLAPDGYLIARMFERRVPVRSGANGVRLSNESIRKRLAEDERDGKDRPDGARIVGFRERKHVHVLGCTECRTANRRKFSS